MSTLTGEFTTDIENTESTQYELRARLSRSSSKTPFFVLRIIASDVDSNFELLTFRVISGETLDHFRDFHTDLGVELARMDRLATFDWDEDAMFAADREREAEMEESAAADAQRDDDALHQEGA